MAQIGDDPRQEGEESARESKRSESERRRSTPQQPGGGNERDRKQLSRLPEPGPDNEPEKGGIQLRWTLGEPQDEQHDEESEHET